MTVSKHDIEAKARQLVAVVDDTTESAKNKAMMGVVAVAVLVGAAFLLGRKRASRNKTMVEVYRV